MVREVTVEGVLGRGRERESLFDPFRRGRTAARESKGLGLGLFIVQQIARAHGGDVTVESVAGKTVFSARLSRG